MTTVADLLKAADPLGDDALVIDMARERIRRAVVTAASRHQPARRALRGRRAALTTAGAVAASGFVIALISGSSDRWTLRAAVRLEVRLAETQPIPGLTVARVADSGQTIYLYPETLLTNDDVAQTWVVQEAADRFGVSVRLLEPGSQRLRNATTAHVDRPLAILIDGKVVMAPVVRSPISDSAMITGNFTRSEAERIAEGIRAR